MAYNYTSIAKIVKVITDLEKKHNLFDWKINNVYVWQSARVNIYVTILDLLIPNNIVPSEIPKIERFKILLKRIFINSLIYNPFLDFSKSDILIFESGRKYLVDDSYIDIYTDYILEDFYNEKVTFCKYETNYVYDHLTRRSMKNKHTDFISIASRIISNFISIRIDKDNSVRIKILENEIEQLLNINIDLESVLHSEIKRFKSEYILYNKLFKRKNPKNIYLTSSGDKSPLIKAAKDNNIEVNELQHGLIVKEGLISHFPDVIEDSLAYFPDKFFVWKELNMWTSKLPVSQNNIVGFTNRHLEYMLKQSSQYKRKLNQILIISQPYCSQEILKFVMNNLDSMESWNIVYKIHPSENLSYFSDKNENQFSQYENLAFVNNTTSIYQLFAESQYVIGVFSTALFEASYFGCKVLLLDLPGVEIASSLIRNGKARLVKSDDKLLDVLG